ncbi:MAG: hypothetical protein ABIF77_20285, partial [bacterium]
MSKHQVDIAARAIQGFAIAGVFRDVAPYRRGHIHNTFVSSWQDSYSVKRFLHQQMNNTVFRDIPGLMHNIEHVTQHLSRRIASGGSCNGFHPLQLVPTRDGESFLVHESGPWRTYHFIENTETFDLCETEAMAYE